MFSPFKVKVMHNQAVFAEIIVKNVIEEKTLSQSSKIVHISRLTVGKETAACSRKIDQLCNAIMSELFFYSSKIRQLHNVFAVTCNKMQC